MHNQEMIDAYSRLRESCQGAAEGLEERLKIALQQSGVKVHTVSHRIKTEHSVRSKISRPDKIYDELTQITDLIGLRVVTYFEDAVEDVARIVEENFTIDFDRSVDKRVTLDPSTFGYRSLHYVCRPSEESLDLPFEIQIRTVLQHAWAEIEHDLGYKFPEAVPSAIKRRFSRVAGLLEIADAEFTELRAVMESYENRVKSADFLPANSDRLDAVLLKSIVESSAVTSSDQTLVHATGKPLANLIFFPDYLIKLLNAAGLNHSAAIMRALSHYGSGLVSFMKRYFAFTAETWGFECNDLDSLQKGYSLFLIAHWKAWETALQSSDPDLSMQTFYGQLDYPNDPVEALRVARLFHRFFAEFSP
ncbi:MAG: hypothetical protein EOP10_04770 [Proteobacteria bacterium]|nr:MAG: hypothetical protein EOP10_04770 [Pseudomonadota bacterium]